MIQNPETRRWIYGIVAALVPLLVTLGTLTDDVARQLLNILAAVLTVGSSTLAIANVPQTDPAQNAHQVDGESPTSAE